MGISLSEGHAIDLLFPKEIFFTWNPEFFRALKMEDCVWRSHAGMFPGF